MAGFIAGSVGDVLFQGAFYPVFPRVDAGVVQIQSFDDVEDVDDEYFREYWDRMVGRKDDLLEGIDELKETIEENKNSATGASKDLLQELLPKK
mgnify:CR=1 FL=1